MKKPRPGPRCFRVEKLGRGHAQQDPHHNRKPGFYLVALEQVFNFSEDWHEDECVNPLVRQYQLALDAILRDRPDLQDCAVRCCHCGIRFFTHPRNAGRQNLRCPFGCRQHHRRRRSNERSKKYYGTDAGRRKKKRLNGKRSRLSSPSPGDGQTPPAPLGQATPKDPSDALSVHSSSAESASAPVLAEALEPAAPCENVALPLEGLVLDEVTLLNSRILPYVRIVASLIEGRSVSRAELLAALRKRMRQHRIARQGRREYVLRYLNQHPP